jgi:ribosomal protein S7
MRSNFDLLLDKFHKALMSSGHSSNSNLIMKDLISKIIRKKDNPQELLSKSIENIKPLFTVSTQKKGKRVLQTPKPILQYEKRVAISANWIVKNSRKHSKGPFVENLLQEVYDSAENQGFSKKQQQELNKLVLINRFALQR